MDRIEPTRALALKVGWAFFWRAGVSWLLLTFLTGVLFGVLRRLVDVGEMFYMALSMILTLSIAFAVTIEVMFRILQKRFDEFDIALLPPGGNE
ncbi:MAG: hypothetical protein HY078_06000 [Elusimicrobia bacterium]|nr:hypothetical protein [Elusimicrobiota bacterium]